MPKAIDLEVKRAEFITASVEVIAHEGLSAATLRKIAREAGCTTGALTHYFANRQQLLLDTLRHVHTSAGIRMASVVFTKSTHREKLLAVLHEALPLDAARFKEWRVWLAFWGASMDDADLSKENRRRYQEWQSLVATLLTPMVTANSLSIESRRLVALIDGLGVSIVRQHVSQQALAKSQNECRDILEQHLVSLLA